MARVTLGFIWERVARDGRLPLIRGADDVVDGDAEAFFGFDLEQAFKLCACLSTALENKVAALKQRSRASEPQRAEQISQVGHRNLLVSADVDPAQKSNVIRHKHLLSI